MFDALILSIVYTFAQLTSSSLTRATKTEGATKHYGFKPCNELTKMKIFGHFVNNLTFLAEQSSSICSKINAKANDQRDILFKTIATRPFVMT